MARAVVTHYARGLAVRTAGTIAAYISLSAPPGRGGGGSEYDLPQLLVRARALESLLEWASESEVYLATAPLVHGGAPPLTTADLARVRTEAATVWWHDAAVGPLFDREGWAVVGAVRVPAQRLGTGALEWCIAALLCATLALAGRHALIRAGDHDAARRALAWYAASALVLGLAAYAQVWVAARQATDHWLADTRALVQDVAARSPGRASASGIAALMRSADLVPGERAGNRPVRKRLSGEPVAAVAVRLGGGRWGELRTWPAETGTLRWVICLVGMALLGPLAAWIAGPPALTRGERTRAAN